MEDATFWGVPQFMWSGVFTLLTTLLAGLIIAYLTSTFLKKKRRTYQNSWNYCRKKIILGAKNSKLFGNEFG